MVTIFYFSSQHNTGTGQGTENFGLRKLAHITEFGLLWFLWWWGFRYRYAAFAAAITLVYAVSDELHQHLVPPRNASPIDILIDMTGMAIVMLIALRWYDRRTRLAGTELNPEG